MIETPHYLVSGLEEALRVSCNRPLLMVVLLAATVLPSFGCGASENVAQTPAPGAKATGESAGAAPPARTVVALETTLGQLTFELDAECAPLTVRNFLEYVERGHYDGTIFHDVDAGYVALAGGYAAGVKERAAGFAIRNEARNGLKNSRGTIAMARLPDTIDSATCQFFVNLADNTHLDYQGETAESYGYCVFGRLIDGQEVLDRLGAVEVRATPDFPRMPVKTVLLERARLVR
jgi:cyclophilin family peptidyl-prolyl cis-trans isomerase